MATSTTNISESILEWWHVLIYAATMFIGFILGTAEQLDDFFRTYAES